MFDSRYLFEDKTGCDKLLELIEELLQEEKELDAAVAAEVETKA